MEYNQKLKDEKEVEIREGYIGWLANFLTNYGSFNDGFFKYEHLEISVLDVVNIEQLGNFANLINSYCKKNHMNLHPTKNHYYIKYQDIFFRLDCVKKTDMTYHWCGIVEHMEPINCIDYEDVKADKISPRAEIINQKISELEKYVKALQDEGLPKKDIEHVMKRVLKKEEK